MALCSSIKRLLLSATASTSFLFMLGCGWNLNKADARISPSSRDENRYWIRARRHLQQAHDVTLFLSLYYLDHDTAVELESRDSDNPLVSHLCRSVNTQASGPQVQGASVTFGASFETFVTTKPSGLEDYSCEIVESNRAYDNESDDIFGPGYFILELAITQVVWVTSSAVLSNNEIRSIVETGFNRGTGGRVRFRSLLHDNPVFNSVLNVEVLSGTLSPPQAAPSATPSSKPSKPPSAAPSGSPSAGPSLPPPTKSPTVLPTLTPTISPTLPPLTSEPTLLPVTPIPTQHTTLSPTDEGERIPLTTEEDRQPLILGAIAGGLVTILVSLFFIFCVWFPCCKVGDDPSTDAEPEGVESRMSSHSDPAVTTLIPGIVNVTDETASLADSTLGEQTSMLLPAKKKLKVAENGPILQQQPHVTGTDSFDESSLYTSNTEPEKASQNMVITKLLPDSLHNTLDFEDDIIFPMSGSGSESESEEEKDALSKSTNATPRAMSSIDMSESTRRISNVGGEFDDTDDSSFMGSSPVQSDEEKAKAISRIIDRNTKGFDPFADDSSGSSSFCFEKIEPVEGAVFGVRMDANDDCSSPSNTTTSTKDVERLLLGSMRTAETHTAADLVIEDHLSSAGSRSSGGSTSSKQSRRSSTVPTKMQPEDRATNNKLLRSVLEDARSLAENRSSTTRSKVSRKSAPSRIDKHHSRSHSSRGSDILADHLDFQARNRRHARRKSSMSVGAPPLPRRPKDDGESAASLPRRSPNKNRTSGESAQSDVTSLPENHRPYRTRYLEAVAKPKAHGSIPPVLMTRQSKDSIQSDHPESESDGDALVNATRGEEIIAVSPSSSSSSVPPSPSGHLGAEPRDRDHVWKIASEDSVMHANSEDTGIPDTPASSPGILGIVDKKVGRILNDDSSADSDGLSNPWLFDVVEQTLGPRSIGADMDSISGRSSRSGRSHRSGRSSRRSRSRRRGRARGTSSTRSRLSGEATESPNSSSKRSRGDPSVTTNESSELAMEPKNLEHDLKRLQLQLADVLQSEMDQVAGSTISVSTAGEGSRGVRKPKKKKKRVVVIVPPGKLGIVLSSKHDGRGTTISEVRPTSTLHGMISPGDKIVAVDEYDVTGMTVNQITSLMASRANSERRLTLISSFYNDSGVDS